MYSNRAIKKESNFNTIVQVLQVNNVNLSFSWKSGKFIKKIKDSLILES